MMLEDDAESTDAFGETVREIEEEFYRTFPAAMLPLIVPTVLFKDGDCFSEDDSTPAEAAPHTWGSVPACAGDCNAQRHFPVATRSNDTSLIGVMSSYNTQPSKGAPVHDESIGTSTADPPYLVAPSNVEAEQYLAPSSSCSLEPEISPAPDKKPPESTALACLFCRGRKIACGPPPLPGSKGRTCNGHAFAALGLPETPRAPTQPRLRGRGEDDEADLTPR
ncbi:hypothetical protein EYR38_002035 [Pleurotus pulmonarius]|nr:hypothetical protein EYR38_002035 [Pleurotus pulmonarius]